MLIIIIIIIIIINKCTYNVRSAYHTIKAYDARLDSNPRSITVTDLTCGNTGV